MKKHIGKLQYFIDLANKGQSEHVDRLMSYLTSKSNIATTRFVDFALSQVYNKEGVDRIKYYLFNGTIIQRNYACLYFNRLNEWKYVKEAFEKGLIDEIQAFSR